MVFEAVLLLGMIGFSILLGFLLGIRYEIDKALKEIEPIEKKLRELLTRVREERVKIFKAGGDEVVKGGVL